MFYQNLNLELQTSFTQQFVCSGGTSTFASLPIGITMQEELVRSYCIVALAKSAFSNGITVSAK